MYDEEIVSRLVVSFGKEGVGEGFLLVSFSNGFFENGKGLRVAGQ